MAGPAIVAILGLALHGAGPATGALAALVPSPQARAENILLDELAFHHELTARGDKAGLRALHIRIAGQIPAMRPAVADLLPPLWSCRGWQCDIAVALIKSEIHRRPQ